MKITAAFLIVAVVGFLGWSQRDRLIHATGAPADAKAVALADVVTIDTSRLVVRRIWAGSDVDVLGTPSPDGRYLSHVDWATGDLAIRDLAAGESRRITNKGSWFESDEFALFSRFSPDGRRLAYNWFNKDFGWDLRVIAMEGGEPEIVHSNPHVDYLDVFDWTPDGERLLILISRADRSNQMAWLSLADGTVRVLKTFDWRYPQRAQVSPDGRWIAYDLQPDEEDPERRDLFVLAADASVETRVVEHPATDFLFGWAPDGRHVVFGSDRTGGVAAWLLPVHEGRAAGRPRLIRSDLWRVHPMGLTRGGALFYGAQGGARDIYLASVDFTTGRVLAPPARAVERFVGSNSAPDWSPDGKYVAYLSQRSPIPTGSFGKALVIRATATGEERVLTPRLNMVLRPRWSPDGRSIMVTGNDRKNRQGVYLVSAQTGEATPLVQAEPHSYLNNALWAPDGGTVYYRDVARGERSIRIMALDVATGASRVVFAVGLGEGSLYPLVLSPDGRRLAYVNSTSERVALEVIPTSGGTPSEVARFAQNTGVSVRAWTPDGTSLVYTRTDDIEDFDAAAEVWVVPVAGGAARQLDLGGEAPVTLAIHPDGRRVVFSAGFNRFEVWVMEGFLPLEDPAATPASGGSR